MKQLQKSRTTQEPFTAVMLAHSFSLFFLEFRYSCERQRLIYIIKLKGKIIYIYIGQLKMEGWWSIISLNIPAEKHGGAAAEDVNASSLFFH